MQDMSTAIRIAFISVGALLASCASIVPQPREAVEGHVGTPTPVAEPSSAIPRPVTRAPAPPAPSSTPASETYTVVVNGVPVRELLFALARDAELNVDIHQDIDGEVTMNAIDQTLPQILERLVSQVDLRYTFKDQLLVVEPDLPFLRTYVIDYLSLGRETRNTVSVSTQLSGDEDSGGDSNTSSTVIESEVNHNVWERVVETITAMLDDGPRRNRSQAASVPAVQPTAMPASNDQTQLQQLVSGLSGAPAASAASTSVGAQTQQQGAQNVIPNAEAGLLTVRATERQHAQIQSYLDRVEASLGRQVLIEATVVEVNLNDTYQAGIDWGRLPITAGLAIASGSLPGVGTAASIVGQTQAFVLEYASDRTFTTNGVDVDRTQPVAPSGDLTVAAQLLQTFGDIKVLSSPKVMTLNNQTAVLKVVSNRVYFQIETNSTTTEFGIQQDTNSTPQTAPEGFVMTVTPQVDAQDSVTLNVRPTITQVLQFVDDPVNPGNRVPEFQVREFESILRAQSGQIAVLGGLMEDRIATNDDRIPLLSDLKEIGDLFTNKNNEFRKTELVVFIRPWVIRKPSVLAGDLKDFRRYLPEQLGPAKPATNPAKESL